MEEILLTWDGPSPIGYTNLSQPEYKIVRLLPREQTTNYRMDASPSHSRKLVGNYSSLFVDFIVRRETGQYYLEYYIPSILLVLLAAADIIVITNPQVTMSWVSFWLDPNAVPGRTTLGTSTWLTMITLTRNTGSDQLPKVN